MGRRALMPREAAGLAGAVFAELKRRRQQAGLSQRAVGEAMGLSAQSVAKLEAGQTTGSVAQLIAWCCAISGRPEIGLPPATAGDGEGERRMSETYREAALRLAEGLAAWRLSTERGEPMELNRPLHEAHAANVEAFLKLYRERHGG